MKRLCGMVGVAILTAAGWWGVSGCDSTTTTDSVITITPADVTLTFSNRTALLTAALASTNRTLVLPLSWSVSDAYLGSIKSSQGLSAVYESAGHQGNQTVTVRDQTSTEGIALIRQL